MPKIHTLIALTLVSFFVLVGSGAAASAATTGLSDPQTGQIVSEAPARFTPHVLDGTVNSITQVGDMIVVGGTFSQVRSATNSTVLTRNRVFAFNAASGAISTSFVPNPNGTVYKVQAAADGASVYVGGSFTTAFGQSRKNLFRADVASGNRVAGFNPPTLSGQVRDLEVVGNRLWVAGKFTHIGGRPQKALGTLNATSGAYDDYFTGTLAGLHRTGRPSDVTNVQQISTDLDNTQLVAVGNFTTVDGAARSQIAKIDISSSASYALADWSTNQFTQACSQSFETYMTDVEYSPDGTFFVVATTGAFGGYSGTMAGTSGCDGVFRFESDKRGSGVTNTWSAYTGGDTTWTVEVTDDVVYAGGHQRWQNNPTLGDKAGQGAVDRPGIASLNAVNGMPFSWNPTRTRGVGVQDMLATSQGLWVGSDTDRIGKYEYHGRIALLPLAGGKTLPVMSNPTLPATVYAVASGGSQLSRRNFDGTAASAPVNAPNGNVGWGTTVGAFMSNGTLYSATSNGALTKRTFDGSTYGAASPVNAADQLMTQSDWHNTDVPTMTSLFLYDGRIYFTRSGQNTLFSRGFEPESDVVGQQRHSSTAVAGISYSGIRGAFVAKGKFYYSNTSGQLFRADWSGTAPVAGTSVHISGPGKDAQNWTSRALFIGAEGPAEPPNQSPTAVARVTCIQLKCSYDGGDSTDSDGTIATYAWDFGDGSSGTGRTTTHTYAAAGPRTVTLTVTDNDGATGSGTRSISPTATPATIDFVASATTNGNRATHAVKIPTTVSPGDALVLLFAANTISPTYTGPSGWTPIGQGDGNSLVSRAWSKVATAADAGAVVSVSSSKYAKSDLTVAAYRGTAGNSPVAAAQSKVDNVPSTGHTSPTVTAPAGENRLVTYWADKSSVTSEWTAPAGQIRRHAEFGTGGGHISSLLTDSNSNVAGSTGGLTAIADSSAQGASFSVVLKPGDTPPPPPNQSPTAAAEVTCVHLACSYDATASTDPDGTLTTYEWKFGDNTTGTGKTTTHTYAAAGSRTVTLTVTDNQGATGTTTRNITPTDAPPTNDPISFVGAASTGGNRSTHRVDIPGNAQVGDALVLFFTANSSKPTYTAPNGWTEMKAVSDSTLVSTAWYRVATAADLGSTVTLTSSAYSKSDLTVAAYRGTSPTDPVAASASRLVRSSGTEHASPSVNAPAGSNWLVSYWADKSSTTTQWTPPNGQLSRSTEIGTGGGHVSSLLVDSNAGVNGATGDLTARTDTASTAAASFSIVLH